MKGMTRLFLLCALFLAFSPASALAKKKSAPEIEWATLATLVVPTFADTQKGKKAIPSDKLKAILDQNVALKGFMMPLDFSSKEVSEFLLMPYVPSCMHVPPPPSNNLIVVKMKAGEKLKATFYPVEVEGLLSLEENTEFESSYKLMATRVSELDPKRMNEDDKKKLESSTPNVDHAGGL